MGGFMPTPAAPAQPPTVKLDTTAISRGNFNNFLKNMSGASSLNPPMAPQMGAMMSPSLAPSVSDIDIFNPPMQMMQEGGNVAPRQTEIMGQPHMLAYITPQEGDILESLGGANKPGPMGIPSFYPGEGDSTAGVDGPSGEADGGASSDPSGTGTGADDGVSDDDPDNTDYSNVDDSAPDDDMDYTDVDYGYTTVDPNTGKSDMDIASEIGQAVAAANAQAGKGRTNIKNVGPNSNLSYSPQFTADIAMSRGLDPSTVMSKEDFSMTTQGKEAQAQMDDAMAIDQAMNQATSIAASTNTGKSIGTDQTNISDALGLGLDLSPSKGTQSSTSTSFSTDRSPGMMSAVFGPEIASALGGLTVDETMGLAGITSPDQTGTIDYSRSSSKSKESQIADQVTDTLGLNQVSVAPSDFTGMMSSRDPAGTTLGTSPAPPGYEEEVGKPYSGYNIDAIEDYYNAPTTMDMLGMPPGVVNSIFSVVENLAKDQVATDLISGNYDAITDSQGNITGSRDQFGRVHSGMDFNAPDTGPNESDSQLRITKPTTPEENTPTNIGSLSGSNAVIPGQPVIVGSPFTTNVGDFQGTGFDVGDLNRLIAQLTGIKAPTSMAKGGVAELANGGLIKAVDDFLSTGQ
tara:strand:- start:1409 stop:3298 length:1890 start_codon:yes stop_codon:yes gene_type:complete